MKLSNQVPVWDKIVFDGGKIQIRLGAYPSILRSGNDSVVYRLNFNINFKKPKDQVDMGGE